VYEWREWGVLVQGISSIINEMESWNTESPVIASFELPSLQYEFESLLSTNIVDNLTELVENPKRLLGQALESLETLSICVDGRDELTRMVRTLIDCIQHFQVCANTCSIFNQFKILHPLRSWLMLLPSAILDISKPDRAVLVTLAHFFAVAVAAASMFPAIDHSYFINPRKLAILGIYKHLTETQFYRCSSCGQVHDAKQMLKYPMTVIAVSLERRAKSNVRSQRTMRERTVSNDTSY